MFGNILKSFSKMLGGTSAEKALKEIDPIVDQINAFFEEYKSLSNDQLRAKTAEFIGRINEYLLEIDNEIADLKDIVLKLQSYTMEVNKMLMEERIAVLSDIDDPVTPKAKEVTFSLTEIEDN